MFRSYTGRVYPATHWLGGVLVCCSLAIGGPPQRPHGLIPNNDQEETAEDAEDAEDCFLITIQAATGARGLNKLFQKKDTGIVDLVQSRSTL